MLEIDRVSKTFGGTQVLRDVSLTVQPGEVLGIVGENGAGKSTLFNIVSGVVTPEEGEVRWRGVTVPPNPRAAIQKGISAVRQELSLCEHRTVGQNVCLGDEDSLCGFVRERRLRERTERILAGLGAPIPPTARITSLTLAQRQTVEIARALSRDAELILLDEPTARLSDDESWRLLRLVSHLQGEDKTFILVSQKLSEVLEVADRIAVLRDGAIVAVVAASETSERELTKLMVGRQLPVPEPRERRRSGGDPVLEVSSLTRPGAFSSVSLRVMPGEIIGLAGMDDSGRTELLESVFGLSSATGDVNVVGRSVKTIPRAIRAGLAYVPPDRAAGLLLALPVRDSMISVHLHRRAWWRTWRDRSLFQLCQEALRHMAVRPPRMDIQARALSGGNQQKLLFARWLAMQAEVWLLDEPTRGIDVGSKVEIYGAIRTQASDGSGFLISSSELPELLQLCDRVLVMHRGRVVADLDHASATEEEIAKYAFGLQNDKKEAAAL